MGTTPNHPPPLSDGRLWCRVEMEKLEANVLALTVERDNLKKMLEDANQREQLQIGVANSLVEQRNQAKSAAQRRLNILRFWADERGECCKLDICRHKLLLAELGGLTIISGGDAFPSDKPVPMCKDPEPSMCQDIAALEAQRGRVDALADLFPPSEQEGGNPT